MGLDIVAHRGLRIATKSQDTVDFPYAYRMAEELDPWAHYAYEEEFVFRGESIQYGFGEFAEQLERLAVDAPLAFAALVESGVGDTTTFGAATSAKLAAAFAAYQPLADAHPDERFRLRYANWRRGCEMAAQGGGISAS